MRHFLIFLCILLLPVLCQAATLPTTLHIVDLRGIPDQPELETWLGSVQGIINRDEGSSAVYLIRNGSDAALANTLVSMYQLQKEVLTPGALLAQAKPLLTGQVRYDPAQPWTRNIALTAAAVSSGKVIVTDADLGLPTVFDLRNRWTDRQSAYAWALAEYGAQVDQQALLLAPESGHLLADLITARKLLAVDLSPADVRERTLLEQLIAAIPAGGRVLGSLDDRCGDADARLWTLTGLLGRRDLAITPARDIANLSCLARFPATRPFIQQLREAETDDVAKGLVLIYGGGWNTLSGSQSLDYSTHMLLELLDDPALADLPVGLEVPMTLLDHAPALYQLCIARQRQTAAELVAAPNGNGWLLPSQLGDPLPYIQRSAMRAKEMGLPTVSLFDTGDQPAFNKLLTGLATNGWRGAFAYPIDANALPDKQMRQSSVLPRFTSLVATSRVRSVAELRAAIKQVEGRPFQVLYVDPYGLPPATLHALLPEIRADRALLTPSQAVRAVAEYIAVMPWLQTKQQQGVRTPRREKPTLQVSVPTTSATAPTAADPIPVTVRITGAAPVLVARAVYQAPDGQIGTVDLQDTGNGLWSAVLPPMLSGGALSIRARVVEYGGFGISFSDPLVINIPIADADEDGVDDTLEEYLGSNPLHWDTDGDGLPDSLDAEPAQRNRDIASLLPEIVPPADLPYLYDAGTSTASAAGRSIPAGSTVRYRIPLQDLPAAPAALSLITAGPGTIDVGGLTTKLFSDGDSALTNEVRLDATQMSGKELLVTFTAGAAPLELLSLGLQSNPDGPYILPIRMTPEFPPAGLPVQVTATVYSPKGIKSVRLRYGETLGALQPLEMKPLAGTGGAVYVAQIPAQRDDSRLIYAIEAEDTAGQLAASPYRVTPVGQAKEHSVALLGTRDLQGSWLPANIADGYGRVLEKGTGEDTFYFRTRPGTYYVWTLAQPRERGVRTHIGYRKPLTTTDITLLDATAPARQPDGWFKLGSFSVKEPIGVNISVTPVGDTGYCAYGSLILTQNEQFTPPLAHAGLDWYNSLTVIGLKNGAIVTGSATLQALPTGNIDVIRVSAKQKTASAGVLSAAIYDFQKQRDGSYTLDTRQLHPGEYEVTVEGMKIVTENRAQRAIPLVTVTLRFTVPTR